MTDKLSKACAGAVIIDMIRSCRLPNTAELAAACGLTVGMTEVVLNELSGRFPIYDDEGLWYWAGDRRAWLVSDLVLWLQARATGPKREALDLIFEALQAMR